MQLKTFSTIAVLGLLCTGCIGLVNAGRTAEGQTGSAALTALQPASGDVFLNGAEGPRHFAGRFLASHFAQSQYDWHTAKVFLEDILAKDPDNTDLLQRAMILAAGSGDMDSAARHAAQLLEKGKEENLSRMILAVKAMQENDLAAAASYLDGMPGGDITAFLKPVLQSWTHAGQGEAVFDTLDDNPVHLYHGALISYYLDDRKQAKNYANKLMQASGISAYEGERAADLLALLGEHESALGFYKGLQLQGGDSAALLRKIEALQDNPEEIGQILAHLEIESPATGAALAVEDLSRILYQENSDGSAQLFTHMALALDPSLTEARILLADILAGNERYDEAIRALKQVPESHYSYMETRFKIVDLMSSAGQTEQARILLEDMYRERGDIDVLIKIGDLFRVEEDYKSSLKAYNKAARTLGSEQEERYWYLFYARGMSYEREGKWNKAESDLQKALSYRPNHPYLLNYLGYSWADQGVKLEKSLELIEKAVSLRPNDGYIVDSLGWVYYMQGRYEEALPHLERAAELLSYDPVINEHLGDVYWKVGRRMEARFQWERARNYAEDEQAILKIDEKLKSGLPESGQAIREAQSSVAQ